MSISMSSSPATKTEKDTMPFVWVFPNHQLMKAILFIQFAGGPLIVPYHFLFPQPLCYSQIQKMQQWKSMNGHSSTVQSVVITLLVGTWQVIPLLSKEITLYLVCSLRDGVLPHALNQVKEPISLRFLPPRHSISQHFTVLLMRDLKRAAVVEQVGGVTAGLPSLQVSWFLLVCLFLIL